MYTIATAGHIDHGKSSLVKALTGIDPDRLPEEKEREMTIELGFAHFSLPTGEEVGIIDVPGHERFIKNMIAGVGALDMVMFVVAADDGWMPQSEEHLAILRYLGISQGIIVLTKVDMVEPSWKDLVKADLQEKTKNTFLEGCELIEFSALDNRNVDVIKQTVARVLQKEKRSALLESARLFVDRVFTIAGTGTVVTGTLREGIFTVGQELFHHPSGEKTKIKSLESFNSHLEKAIPGIRLAVGLQSLDKASVERGDLFHTSRQLMSSSLLGIRLVIEPKKAHLLKHNRNIIFLHGTSEVAGKIILPPEPVVCQSGEQIALVRLETPVITRTGDRFILRLPTPSVLVGGGVVLDPLQAQFKRNQGEKWTMLRNVASLDVADVITYELQVKQIIAAHDLLFQSLFPAESVQEHLQPMIESKSVIRRDRFIILKQVWDNAQEKITGAVKEFHSRNQHLASMPLAMLTTQVKLHSQLFDFTLESLISSGKLERFEAGIRIREYAAGLSSSQEQSRKKILAVLRENGRMALSRDELLAQDKDAKKIYAYLRQKSEIVDIGGMIYLKETFDQFTSEIVGYLKTKGKMTVAEARDLTQTSRKVILPLLEELDRQKITKRDGDYRMLCS